jgi:hypothetical protein
MLAFSSSRRSLRHEPGIVPATARSEDAMIRRTSRFFLAAGLLLGLSGPVHAATYIFTPPLLSLPTGSLLCDVVNTVDAPITFEVDILTPLGVSVNELEGSTQYPSGNPLGRFARATHDSARFCRVKITSGNKKNLRVSLQARDAGAIMVAAVAGY